jgi:hypothetical protein
MRWNGPQPDAVQIGGRQLTSSKDNIACEQKASIAQ